MLTKLTPQDQRTRGRRRQGRPCPPPHARGQAPQARLCLQGHRTLGASHSHSAGLPNSTAQREPLRGPRSRPAGGGPAGKRAAPAHRLYSVWGEKGETHWGQTACQPPPRVGTAPEPRVAPTPSLPTLVAGGKGADTAVPQPPIPPSRRREERCTRRPLGWVRPEPRAGAGRGAQMTQPQTEAIGTVGL